VWQNAKNYSINILQSTKFRLLKFWTGGGNNGKSMLAFRSPTAGGRLLIYAYA